MSEGETNDGKSEEKEEEKEKEKEEADDTFSEKHLILKVVEIASVASRTSCLASEAEQRHRHLMELTEKAKAEVDSIREIARSMAQTAGSVARVALEVCRYSSCEEAFERHSVHCCRLMDLESFLEVVSNKASSYPTDQVDVNAKMTSDPDRTDDTMATVAMTTVPMVNDEDDDDDDDAVSVEKSESGEEEEVTNDCSCLQKEHMGCRSIDVNWKGQRHPVFLQCGLNSPSNPDFRSCCFSCISPSDSSVASSGSEARFLDRERGSEDERVQLAKQNSSFSKILPQLQQQLLRSDSTTKLRGRACLLEVSSDSEVEEILQRKPVESPTVQKLRNLELRTTDGMECSDLLTQKRTDKSTRRPVSPLLDHQEKENYAVSGEEVGRNSPKHLFTPPLSVISSAEQINKRTT